MIFEDRYLAIYLTDHYAGATGGLELARRARDSNEGTPLGDELARLAEELKGERERLREIMRHFEVEPDRIKVAGAWAGEKVGRLKLNGELTSYSPLSRLVELEGLFIGVNGKLSMWRNLERTMGEHLAAFDLQGLIAQAEDQRERIERMRFDAAAEALPE